LHRISSASQRLSKAWKTTRSFFQALENFAAGVSKVWKKSAMFFQALETGEIFRFSGAAASAMMRAFFSTKEKT
jgi:hypothetical protein